jgi:hypothetical protein
MKKCIFILLFALSFSTTNAQKKNDEEVPVVHNFNLARSFFDTIESKIVFTSTYREPMIFGDKITCIQRNLMSNQGLNVFMARKVNSYLSGSGDLSLYKAYFIVDPTDGKLFVGYNFANDPSDGDKMTRFVHNVGFNANLADAFSTIYSGEDKKLTNDLGLTYKVTLLGRGIINFNRDKPKEYYNNKSTPETTSQEISEIERLRFRNQIFESMKKDSIDYVNSLKGVDSTSEYRKNLDDKFYEKKNKEYKKKYIIEEATFIDEEENYNWYWSHWASLSLFIPFSKTEYNTAIDFKGDIQTQYIYSYDGSFQYNQILELKKTKWYGNLTVGAKNLNNIKTDEIDKYSFNDYKTRVSMDTSSLNLVQIKSTDVYVGNYISEPTAYFSLQVVSFFLASKSIGLSAEIEHYTGNYHPINIKFGVPFALKGKDDDTKANFELQVKLNDISNSAFPEKSVKNKMIFGLSVGIPLTSKIY